MNGARISPQAHVQRLCLVEIERKPAGSVTELATRVGSVRSTVSRAVNALVRGGLLVREGRRLELTEAGRAEVTIIRAVARERMAKAERMVGRAAKVAD